MGLWSRLVQAEQRHKYWNLGGAYCHVCHAKSEIFFQSDGGGQEYKLEFSPLVQVLLSVEDLDIYR